MEQGGSVKRFSGYVRSERANKWPNQLDNNDDDDDGTLEKLQFYGGIHRSSPCSSVTRTFPSYS